MLLETRETIVWVFQRGDYHLDQRNDMGSLFQPPLDLLEYTLSIFATQDQRDNEAMLTQVDQQTVYDPSVPLNVYFSLLQDTRYHPKESGQPDLAMYAILI